MSDLQALLVTVNNAISEAMDGLLFDYDSASAIKNHQKHFEDMFKHGYEQGRFKFIPDVLVTLGTEPDSLQVAFFHPETKEPISWDMVLVEPLLSPIPYITLKATVIRDGVTFSEAVAMADDGGLDSA